MSRAECEAKAFAHAEAEAQDSLSTFLTGVVQFRSTSELTAFGKDPTAQQFMSWTLSSRVSPKASRRWCAKSYAFQQAKRWLSWRFVCRSGRSRRKSRSRRRPRQKRRQPTSSMISKLTQSGLCISHGDLEARSGRVGRRSRRLPDGVGSPCLRVRHLVVENSLSEQVREAA